MYIIHYVDMKKEKINNDIQFAILATDVAILTLRNDELYIKLINVDRPPYFVGIGGLPGGLVAPKETALDAATRHSKEKAHIDPEKLHMEQLYTFSDVNRDPRGRVVSVGYLALVPWDSLSVSEQKDTKETWWAKAIMSKKLAYDHNRIIDMAISRLRSRITYTTLISKILPKEFTLTELEKSFESVLGKDIDKRNFRKKIEKLGILKELDKMRRGQKHRPASLYSFKSASVREIDVL